MNKKIILIGISLSFVLISLIMIISKEWTLSSGTVVVLDTIPVDPRDVFRGDYVDLRYTIGNIELSKMYSDIEKPMEGQRVYIVLEKKQKFWDAKKVLKNIPTDGSIAIQGRIINVYGNNIRMRYGIENYFMPEGRGKDIEELINQKNSNSLSRVSVEIVVDKNCKPLIRNILVDDKPYKF